MHEESLNVDADDKHLYAQVYQFYNMVGAPLGNHGTTKNVGRYLCIRQELQQNMLDESERQFSWWYNKVYLPACDREEAEIEAHLKDYKQAKNDALKAEHEYRAAVGDDEKALLEVGLDILPDTSDDEDGDEKVTREDEEESVVDAPAIRMEAKIMEEDTCEQDATTVSGGNMGQPKAQPQGKVKKIKTNKVQKTMSAIERQMENINVGGSIQNTYTDKEIRELKMAFLSARKDAAVQPEDTFKIKLLRYFKYFLSLFLPYNEKYLRAPGHVHYTEIIMAMLYWLDDCLLNGYA